MKFLHFTLLMMMMMPIIVHCGSYDGYKVYEVTPKSFSDVNFIKSLDGDDDFDFWSLRRPVGTKSTVMVKPERQYSFENSLNARHIEYKITIMDLEEVLNNERQFQSNVKRSNGKSGEITFDRYHRYDEINKYLDNLAASNRNYHVRSIGKSYEGREIKTIRLTNGDGNEGKNVIYIDAGIHAREWISPATALYLIQELTTGNSTNLLNQVDIIIQPLVNPDGYEYTHTQERMWRKTRSGKLPVCRGTDANRNFGFHWGEVGASPVACSETYRGEKAFSEKESIALRDAVAEIGDKCKFYLTIHSFGNYLLYPWGYTSDLPATWHEIDEIANVGKYAIGNATGTEYTVGSSTNVLYAAAGGSDDFMLGVLNVPISITMELPGGSQNSFILPPNEIKETVKESAIGIFAMIEAVANKYK